MAKILPKVYVNKIGKPINNNNSIFYSAKPPLEVEQEKKELVKISSLTNSDLNIELKIDKMFNSPNYVYKMDTQIIMKDGKRLNKQIIGKVDDKLITIDEEYVLIHDIKDIIY